jgi:hypothetical protein
MKEWYLLKGDMDKNNTSVESPMPLESRFTFLQMILDLLEIYGTMKELNLPVKDIVLNFVKKLKSVQYSV